MGRCSGRRRDDSSKPGERRPRVTACGGQAAGWPRSPLTGRGSDPEFGGEGQGARRHFAGQRHSHERLIGDVDVQGDAEAWSRGEPEARIVLSVTDDDGECLTTAGRLGEERFDHRGACAGPLVLGSHGTGRQADAWGLTDEASGKHGVGDDLTVEDADERQTFDPTA